MSDASLDEGGQLHQAEAVLAATTELIDRALSALKDRTTVGDQVSSAKLDEHQIVSYDLSLSWSECTAASFLLAHAKRLAFAQQEPAPALV